MNATAKVILAALDGVTVDALVTKQHAEDLATELAAALDAAGYTVRKKPAPRKTAAAEPAFEPNTGDPKLDDFMRRKHNPKARIKSPPAGRGLPALRPMKVSEQVQAEADWNRACEAAAVRVAEGKPSDAERELRALIALHRPTAAH